MRSPVASLSTASPRQTAKIFGTPADLWTVYDARLEFRDKLIGGIPKDPRLIEGWLRSKAGIDDPQDLRLAVLRTLDEVGGPTSEARPDDSWDNAASLASQKRTTGFKADVDGLYVEGRQVKAMLKESTNIVFAGERWGPTRKAARAFFAERVFIEPDRLRLGIHEPTGVELVVGHLVGPTGPTFVDREPSHASLNTCALCQPGGRGLVMAGRWCRVTHSTSASGTPGVAAGT